MRRSRRWRRGRGDAPPRGSLRAPPAAGARPLAGNPGRRDGLKFTQLAYKQQWAEADARIERIKTDKLVDKFRALGGEAFAKQLDATHKAYGVALGITKEKNAPDVAPVLLEPLRETQAALRKYAVSVVANVDDEDEASTELADRLLAPLRNWVARADRGEAKPGVAPGA